MASGDCTVSGAYLVSDKTGIAAFIKTKIGAAVSGAQVFIIPSGGNTCYVGIAEGLG
jgi:hypothetical protein